MSDRQTATMLLHGESGFGKSWLCDTLPAPRCILDVEGRAKHTPSGPKIWWNPVTQAPPAAPTAEAPWETCVVNVNHFGLLDTCYQWFRSGQHPFRSVGVDSLMEAQKRWMDSEVPDGQLRTQDWGSVLRALETFVRNMRDIVNYDASHVDYVCIVTGSVPDERGKARPLLQGQLKNTLPYYVDVCGWLTVQPKQEDSSQVDRVLWVGPTPNAVTKYGLGPTASPYFFNPTLSEVFNVQPNPEVT